MGAETGRAMPHDASGAGAILDSAGATARVLGDGALYLRMLGRFQHDHPAGATPIRAALDSGDRERAHRLAHTLKGSAGMIGAHLLQEHASALEARLRTGGAAAAELNSLEEALAEVLVVVARLLDGAPAAPVRASTVPVAAPTPAIALLLGQLETYLDTGDGAAIDLLQQAGPTLKGALGAAAFSELMLAVHAFEFEAALAALRGALPQRGGAAPR